MDPKAMIEERNALLAEIEGIEDAARAERRELTEDEAATIAKGEERCAELKSEIELRAARAERRELSGVEKLIGATEPEGAKPAAGSTEVRSRPVYGADRGDLSWFVDAAKVRLSGDAEALTRMQQHADAERDIAKRDLYINAGNGGELAPPAYLQSLWVQGRTAGAVAASLCRNVSLDGFAGQSVTIPKITGNTGVGSQTEASPLNALTETDATTGAATESIVAKGGVQDLSGLLVRRSFPGADAVIVENLAKQVAAGIDTDILANSTTPQSILGASSINAVTYTDASPTVPELFPKLADAVQQIHAGWYSAPTAIVVHPRRAADWMASLDSSNRPLVAPMQVAQNPLAHTDGGAIRAEGFTGISVMGLPVYADANVPITEGSGTNEDVIFLAVWDQALLFTSSVMLDISREASFKADGVTVKAVQDFTFVCEHAPEAFATIGGTGLAAPSF